MYVELHAASAFSFLQGASLPEALVERAAALGYPALALLDRDGVYGAPRFHKAAIAAGIKPIIGAELTIGTGGTGGAGGTGRTRGEPLRRPVLDTREGNGPSASGMGVGPHAGKQGGAPAPVEKSKAGAPSFLLPVLC